MQNHRHICDHCHKEFTTHCRSIFKPTSSVDVVDYHRERKESLDLCDDCFIKFYDIVDDYKHNHTPQDTEHYDPADIMNFTKVNDFLYDMRCLTLDYDYASSYFLSKKPTVSPSGCSSVRSGNFYGRNLDWLYDNNVEFIVRTEPTSAFHGTIGVAGAMSTFNKKFMENPHYEEFYKIIPFMINDGINDAGVVCNTNVVPLQKGTTSGTTPTVATRHVVSSIMLLRFILDRFSSATEAVNYIKSYVSVYVPTSLRDLGFESHIMVADKDHTYVIEFINNAVEIINVDAHPIMTNFHLHGVTRNADGSVYTPETQDLTHNAMITNNITSHGVGLERYNLINSRISTANTKEGMRSLLNELSYSNAYKYATTPFWYTEYVGTYDVASRPGNFSDYIYESIGYFNERQRGDGKTWQTNHSSIYNIKTKTLSIVNQEGYVEYTYDFPYVVKKDLEDELSELKNTIAELTEDIIPSLIDRIDELENPTPEDTTDGDDTTNPDNNEEPETPDPEDTTGGDSTDGETEGTGGDSNPDNNEDPETPDPEDTTGGDSTDGETEGTEGTDPAPGTNPDNNEESETPDPEESDGDNTEGSGDTTDGNSSNSETEGTGGDSNPDDTEEPGDTNDNETEGTGGDSTDGDGETEDTEDPTPEESGDNTDGEPTDGETEDTNPVPGTNPDNNEESETPNPEESDGDSTDGETEGTGGDSSGNETEDTNLTPEINPTPEESEDTTGGTEGGTEGTGGTETNPDNNEEPGDTTGGNSNNSETEGAGSDSNPDDTEEPENPNPEESDGDSTDGETEDTEPVPETNPEDTTDGGPNDNETEGVLRNQRLQN